MSKFTTGKVYYGETLRRILAPRQDTWRDVFKTHEFWVGITGGVIALVVSAWMIVG